MLSCFSTCCAVSGKSVQFSTLESEGGLSKKSNSPKVATLKPLLRAVQIAHCSWYANKFVQ